jgi:prepilin-type N-terminal cleavage/methylation domain-containing protein
MCRWIGSRGASLFTRTPRPSGESGFTLLEVLVAFAVLAVMIVPILQVFGGGLGMTETARAYSTAALLARSKLAEVGAGEDLEEGETTGNFESYQWRRTISRSELTAAETEDRDEPDEAKGSRTRKQRRESRLFGDRESGRQGRSGFGEGRSGFGDGGSGRQGRSGFGEGRSGFGDGGSGRQGRSGFGEGRSGFGERQGSVGERRSGFGESHGSFGRSGQSAFPTGRSGASDGRETATGNAGGQQSEDLIPYEVTVTVEWGNRAGGGALSLSTLRLGRQNDSAGAGGR